MKSGMERVEMEGTGRQRITKSLLVLFILFAWVFYGEERPRGGSGDRGTPTDRVCMMQDTIHGSPAIPLVRDGKTYYGCCEMCKEKIASEPARYTLAKDPLSERVVDKAVASLLSVNGRVLYFESDVNRARFRKIARREVKRMN